MKRVDDLERAFSGVSGATESTPHPSSAPSSAAVVQVSETGKKTGKESALSVGGVAALMSRGSLISLILLFALVLCYLDAQGAESIGEV